MLALLIVSGCSAAIPRSNGRPSSDSTLTVFAAASLKDAFEAIGQEFNSEYPAAKLEFNFAGSQQLAQQLASGAPGDVFASANRSQMDVAIASGRVAVDASRVFAGNRLVVVLPKDGNAGVAELKDLARPGLKIVLADKTVPAGSYALQFLEKAASENSYGASYSEDVRSNIASHEENGRSVLNKVILGEADAGIVYQTDATPLTLAQVAVIEIPVELNVTADYTIAPVVDSPKGPLAQEFVSYVLSPGGQQTLQDYGFLPAQPAPP